MVFNIFSFTFELTFSRKKKASINRPKDGAVREPSTAFVIPEIVSGILKKKYFERTLKPKIITYIGKIIARIVTDMFSNAWRRSWFPSLGIEGLSVDFRDSISTKITVANEFRQLESVESVALRAFQ